MPCLPGFSQNDVSGWTSSAGQLYGTDWKKENGFLARQTVVEHGTWHLHSNNELACSKDVKMPAELSTLCHCHVSDEKPG